MKSSNEAKVISQKMAEAYANLEDAVVIFPDALALQVQKSIASGDENVLVRYAMLEHLKQVARNFLRHSNSGDLGDTGDDTPTQSDMFELQDRYPLPKGNGYKKRQELTPIERAYNVAQLRKKGRGYLRHADELEAEGLSSDGRDSA